MIEIIIIVDLGIIKAYEIVKDPFKIESDRLETIESHIVNDVKSSGKSKGAVSGRFYQGGGTSGTKAGSGEQHAIELEAKSETACSEY